MASGNVSFAPRRTSVGRTTAGLLALAYPLLMVVMALAVGSREPGNLQDFAASFVAAVMLVIALPTTWFLSFDFIEVSRTTVVVFGLVTSLPLWYVLGTALAVRSGASDSSRLPAAACCRSARNPPLSPFLVWLIPAFRV